MAARTRDATLPGHGLGPLHATRSAMSFILDALQKSERERHAGQTPAIDEALTRPLPEPRRGRRQDETALVVRTVLIVSAVFLIAGLTWWLLSRTQRSDGPTVAESRAAPAAELATAAPPPAPADQEVIPVPPPSTPMRVDPERLQAPISSADLGPDAASLDDLLDEAPAAPEAAPPPVDALPQEAPAEPAAPPPPPPRNVARPLKDMPPSFRSEFPALSVQVHVYDPNPLRRFVLINGKKYRETDTLVEGPQVVEIVEHGIVLDQRGTRVLIEMPR